MKLGVTGASGFLGTAILAEAKRRRYETVGFSRDPDQVLENCDELRSFQEPESSDFGGLDGLIHLAGENIVGRWTKEKKKKILTSRVESTRGIVSALQNLPEGVRPKTFVSASGIGIYGDCGDEILDEDSDIGFQFLAGVCRDWEKESLRAEGLGIRTVIPRVGLVLGSGGGIAERMRLPFLMGLGGRLGSGRQWMSWIHLQDAARVFLYAVESATLRGAVNCVSPHPVTNAEFTHAYAKSLGRKALFPIPSLVLRMLPGGMGDIFLTGQRVDPVALRAYEFDWQFPKLEEALHDIVAARKKKKSD